MTDRFDYIKTKDQLGRPDTAGLLVKRKSMSFDIDDVPLIIESENIGSSWIVGHARNGLVGANTNTISGNQQVVGSADRVNTVMRVVNTNNTFREHFRTETMKGTPFTATWDTSNFKLAMNEETNHDVAYNTIATFNRIYYNQDTVFNVVPKATETKWGNDLIQYWFSANGGSNWELATINQKHLFTNRGQELILKVIFVGNGGSSTYLEDLEVQYNV